MSQTNIIYAPNGSGKTTLSLIIQSLKDDNRLLGKKIIFADLQLLGSDQLVRLRVDGKTVEYKNLSWSDNFPSIEIFNVHFVENTLFSGSRQMRDIQQNFFTYLAGEEGASRKKELAALRRRRLEIRSQERKIGRSKAKKADKEALLGAIQPEKGVLDAEIVRKDQEMGVYTQRLFQEFTAKVNEHLAKFSRSLRLEKISKELDQSTTFYLQFGTNRITFHSRENGHEFKYTLSAGISLK